MSAMEISKVKTLHMFSVEQRKPLEMMVEIAPVARVANAVKASAVIAPISQK